MGLKSPEAPAYITRSVRVSSWVTDGPSSPSLTSSKNSFCSPMPPSCDPTPPILASERSSLTLVSINGDRAVGPELEAPQAEAALAGRVADVPGGPRVVHEPPCAGSVGEDLEPARP